MNPNGYAAMASLPWAAGWCFSPVDPRDERVQQSGCVLRTLGTPGDIAPLGIPARWSFHLGITARPSSPRPQLRADGFRIHFTWDDCECVAMGVVIEPGVLIGYTDAPLRPSLFSAEHEIHRAGDVEWIEMADLHVVLVPSNEGNLHKFCLAAGPWEHTEAVNHARQCLDGHFKNLFEEGDAYRQQIADQLTDIPPGLEELVSHAVESLIARTQPAEGPFPHRWCSTGDSANPLLNVNLLYGLTAAWSRIDSRMAENTLRTLLSFQRPDGALPVMLTADGSADFARAPHPIMARTVKLLEGNTAFIRYALPHLRNYIAWALRYFDPEEAGLPRWRNAHEAWVSATFDSRICSADLTALLLSEIQAYESMARKLAQAEAWEFRAAASRYAKTLQTRFWDPSLGAFLDTFDNGAHVERITFGSVFSLLWEGLGDVEQNAVLRLLDRSGGLSTPCGMAQWVRWDGDSQNPPVYANDQIHVLDAIRQADASGLDRKIRITLWKSLEAVYARSKRLSDEFVVSQPQGKSAKDQTPSAFSSAAAASLAVILAGAPIEQAEEEDDSPGFKGWMVRHAKTVVGTAVAVPALAALITIIAYTAKTTPPLSSLEASLGMAMQYYRIGNYDKAIAVYENLVKKARRPMRVEFQLGNAYFRRGDLQRAESLYRATLNQPEPPPAVFLNLGLALFRQGRLQEAIACYAQYLDEFGDRWPDQAERARTAIDLIQRYHTPNISRFAQGS